MSFVPPKPPHEESDLRFWWLQEEDRILGPYTGRQMLSFLMKGRLKPETLVRPDTARGWRPASRDPEFGRYFQETAERASPAERRLPAFLIMAGGGAEARVEAVIGELGRCLGLMPHIWLLQSALPAEKICTYLVRQLGAAERLFVVDMRTGAYTAHKFGEEMDARIRGLFEPDEEAEA